MASRKFPGGLTGKRSFRIACGLTQHIGWPWCWPVQSVPSLLVREGEGEGDVEPALPDLHLSFAPTVEAGKGGGIFVTAC